jgi:PAS domain S-box-containing protein
MESKQVNRAALLFTAIITLTMMTVYEWTKQLINPNITIWQSHCVTIIFSTVLATLATRFVLRRYLSLKRQTEEEIRLRREVEQSRDELLTKTDQLVRTTRELENEIAKHTKTADVLRESRHFNEKILDTTPNMIYIYNIRSSRLIYRNRWFDIFASLQGDQAGKVRTGLSDMMLLHEGEKTGADLVEQLKVGPDGTVVEHELKVLDKQGEPRWVWAQETVFSRTEEGEPDLILGIARDITEERDAISERERLSSAIEAIAEGILVMSGDGYIQYANLAACAMMGHAKREILGRNIRSLKPPKGTSLAQFKWDALIQTGTAWSGRMRAEERNGVFSDIEVTISPIRETSGTIANYVVIGRDVTEEVKLERQLRRAQKMEAVATLSGGIAHDFNNILAAVLGFTDLALEDDKLGNDTRHFLEQVARAGLRGRDLVRHILTMSRRTEEEPKPTLLRPIIKETIRLLRASLPSTIDIAEEISADTLAVQGDTGQVQQVLMNLCTNAADAMKDRGGILKVALDTVRFDHDGGVPHLDLHPGRYARLSVADTGTGIRREIMERIFDPFFTTKGLGEGTGLGLAVVQGIIKNHGGAIIVKSEHGKGSIFEVYWPVIDIETSIDNELSEPPIATGGERILLVDDEEAIVEMGGDILGKLGYVVTSVRSSTDALAAFKKDPSRFDLVVTDQTMPDMTGMVLAKEILAVRPDIPVILTTGFSHAVNEETARAAGLKGFVIKPLTRREIARTIRKALDE